MMEIQGKSILVRVSMRFELVKVQVIDSQSTVRNTDTPLTGTLSMAPQYPY